MLSIGKTPPDPPCASDELIPPLNNSDETDKASPPPDLILNPSLPKFSIREYVFAQRSKDISKNWPFSLRSLQLCQKHGVKDLLPPFQSPDDVRHRPFAKEINPSKTTEEPLRLNNEDNAKSNDGLADNNFPSTTTSVSRAETETVPAIRKLRNNSVSVRPDSLPAATSVEKRSAGPTVVRKTRTAVRSMGRRGRPVVKPDGNLERSSAEDIASPSSAVSEAMASKVCPVCKTFSSSSNTTLNAHIDQCLSEEPTPKWSAGSRLSRHRVKPRKTRLMVDIYKTAPRCTLEDLDRRNGTNWATGTKLLRSQDAETVQRTQRVPPVNPDQDAGAVYVDSNGRKLRSLSSFSKSQPSSSRAGEDLEQMKRYKGKTDKVLLPKRKKKKKKKTAQKYHNNPKVTSKSKDFSSHKASQDSSDQEDSHGAREASDGESLPVSRSQSPLPFGHIGTLKPWPRSRRSALPKKIMAKDPHPPHGCALHIAQDLLVDRVRPHFANSPISDEYDSGSPEQPRNNERMGVELTEGESSGKSKLGSPFYSGPADRNLEESNFRPVKRRESQSSDASEADGDCTFHDSNKTGIPPIAYRKPSESSGISPTKVMKFSRVKRRNGPPTRFLRRPDLDETRKVSAPEQPEMHLKGDMNKEDNADGNTNPTAVTGSFGQGTGRKSASEEVQFGDNYDGKGAESSVNLSTDKSEKLGVQGQGYEDEGNDNMGAFELQSKLGTEDNPSNFSKYLNQGTPIENRRVPARSTTEICKDGLRDIENPNLPGVIVKDLDDGTNRQGSDVNLNLDTQVGQDYEVERIPIPGPPGSFLPSPGALGSEEFQGNSSLTTSRVQSSQEPQDLANGGSSGSPISATSTVSNSAPAGSEAKSLAGPQAVEEKASSGSSHGGAVEPLVSNAASAPQPSTMGVPSERKSIEKGPMILKNDNQPCCCQRKERIPEEVVPIDYPESQLLRRRNLDSLTAIGLGNPPNQSPNVNPVPVEARNEMLPRGAVQEIESEVARSSSVPIPFMGSSAFGAKVSDRGDFNAPTPPNPVLRLMGKNLMVVNQEQDASTPLRHSQSPASAWSNNPSSSQVPEMTGVPSSSVPFSFTDYRPAVGTQFRTVMEPPAAQPTQFKTVMEPPAAQPTQFQTVMEPPAAPPGMPINWQVSGYNNGTFYFPNQPPRSNVVLSEPRDPRPMKEIIIIDDSPEDEITYMPANYVGRVGVPRERQASVAPPPVVSYQMQPPPGYDPRLAGTFPFAYASQDPSFFGQVPISRRAGSSAMGVRWCSSPPESPGAFQQGHLLPAQSPNTHTRSQLPYSRGQ